MSPEATPETIHSLDSKTGVVVASRPLINHSLRSLIEGQPDMRFLGAVETLSALEPQIEGQRPAVSVVDFSLVKTGSIFDAIERLREKTAMIMLQDGNDVFLEKHLIAAGVRGVVSLDDPADRVVEAIRDTRNGAVFASDALARRLLGELNDRGEVQKNPAQVLAPRELEVFCMFGKGMKAKEVAAKLGLSVKTIESNRQHIELKLKLLDVCELCRTATLYVQGLQGNGEGAAH